MTAENILGRTQENLPWWRKMLNLPGAVLIGLANMSWKDFVRAYNGK